MDNDLIELNFQFLDRVSTTGHLERQKMMQLCEALANLAQANNTPPTTAVEVGTDGKEVEGNK